MVKVNYTDITNSGEAEGMVNHHAVLDVSHLKVLLSPRLKRTKSITCTSLRVLFLYAAVKRSGYKAQPQLKLSKEHYPYLERDLASMVPVSEVDEYLKYLTTQTYPKYPLSKAGYKDINIRIIEYRGKARYILTYPVRKNKKPDPTKVKSGFDKLINHYIKWFKN